MEMASGRTSQESAGIQPSQSARIEVIGVGGGGSLPKVCEHFHIPFQSGSNKILKNMGRGYTIESYKNIINYIKAKIPKAAISGDAIVAFPGESETDYLIP